MLWVYNGIPVEGDGTGSYSEGDELGLDHHEREDDYEMKDIIDAAKAQKADCCTVICTPDEMSFVIQILRSFVQHQSWEVVTMPLC